MSTDRPSRDLSLFGAFALAFGCIVGGGSFVMPGTAYLPSAGPAGTALAFAIGVPLTCLVAVNVSLLMTKGTAQGIYGIVRETFGAKHAFVCGWCLLLVYVSLIPLNASALCIVGNAAPHNVLLFGPTWRVLGYDVVFGEVMLSVAALVLVAFCFMRGARLEGLPQSLLVVVLVGCLAAIMVAAGASGQLDPANLTPAFAPDVDPAVGVVKVVAVLPWAFVGFEVLTFWADMPRLSARRLRRVMLASVLAGAAVYLALVVLAASVGSGGRLGSWPAFVGNGLQASDIGHAPTYLAAVEALPGGWGMHLYMAAATAALLSCVVGFFAASLRLIRAMASSHALPHQLAELSGTRQAPVKACVSVALISVGLVLLGRNALNWIVDMSSVGTTVVYGYLSAAVLLQGFRERRWLRFACGLMGCLLCVVLLALLFVPVPALGSSLNAESYVCLITWVALGVNFYTPSAERRLAR